ncbi:MAG: response regulator transcription factor [Ignavibacteriales bacterium]|nr:response regulator transcription factor [Ignavibacteriales bacterium]
MVNMTRPISLVLADDHPIVRTGIKQIIEAESRITIVGEADNGEKALELILEMKPDIALLDIHMPKKDGLTIAEELQFRQWETRVILLTMHNDEKTFLKAVDLGVRGYVLKDSAVEDVVKAIHAVAEEEFYVSPELAGILIKRRRVVVQKTKDAQLSETTETERKILWLIADLKSNQEIADLLFISKRTVENHRVNISKKLGLQGKNELLRFAFQHKEALM